MPDLLDLRHLTASAWDRLLASAELLAGPRGREPLLAGRRCAMVFLQSSLRTRTAFEVACHDLGAHAVHLQVGGGLWRLEHRDGVVMDGDAAEHVREGFGVLSRMVDALGIRSFAGLVDAAEDRRDTVLGAVATAATVPVLSLESAMDHPQQGLADALTVRRQLGRDPVKVVVTWAPHVKPLPLAVPHAALLAFARDGHDVAVTHPPGYELDEGVVAEATALARAVGGRVVITPDRQAALEGARVVYAKSWGSRAHYGDLDAARADLAARRDWIVSGSTMAATEDAVFMHCLPVRRNLVVADEVLDGPASVVLDQAAARLDVAKAALCHALEVEP
jgi:N-acetylornithine carbamoyltransferase